MSLRKGDSARSNDPLAAFLFSSAERSRAASGPPTLEWPLSRLAAKSSLNSSQRDAQGSTSSGNLVTLGVRAAVAALSEDVSLLRASTEKIQHDLTQLDLSKLLDSQRALKAEIVETMNAQMVEARNLVHTQVQTQTTKNVSCEERLGPAVFAIQNQLSNLGACVGQVAQVCNSIKVLPSLISSLANSVAPLHRLPGIFEQLDRMSQQSSKVLHEEMRAQEERHVKRLAVQEDRVYEAIKSQSDAQLCIFEERLQSHLQNQLRAFEEKQKLVAAAVPTNSKPVAAQDGSTDSEMIVAAIQRLETLLVQSTTCSTTVLNGSRDRLIEQEAQPEPDDTPVVNDDAINTSAVSSLGQDEADLTVTTASASFPAPETKKRKRQISISSSVGSDDVGDLSLIQAERYLEKSSPSRKVTASSECCQGSSDAVLDTDQTRSSKVTQTRPWNMAKARRKLRRLSVSGDLGGGSDR